MTTEAADFVADVLAIAAHRDDVEQTCGGTLLRMAARGLRTAILDLTQGEVDVLFSFFGERYEKQRSVFVTTNLAFSEWEKVFKNPMTATAIVDRLVHRCVLLEFPAKRSIREDDAKKRQASA